MRRLRQFFGRVESEKEEVIFFTGAHRSIRSYKK